VDPPAPGLPGIDFPGSTLSPLSDAPDDLSAVIDLPPAPALRSAPGRSPSGEFPVMPLEWPRVDSGRPVSDDLPVLGAHSTTGIDEPDLRRSPDRRPPSPDEAFPFTEQDLAPDDEESPLEVEPLSDPVAPAGNRAGRNLPAAIAVGVLLGVAVAVSLYTRPEAFVGVAAVAVILGIWEVTGALSAGRITVPFIPLAVGSLGMLVSAFVAAEEGLLVSFTLTALGIMLWRVIDGLNGAVKDVVAGIFTAAYVPLLAGFAILMLASPRGRLLVLVFVLVTIASDIGGYLAGVLFGVHPMAPSVSPKKSWEGFAGSAAACLTVGVVGVGQILGGPWWVGAVLGAATVVAATLGDLSESMLKRDLGIKDMGTTLPGHGGVMDRLDSLLLTAPVAYLILTQVLPAVQGMTSLGLP
jgi:phosphatidate cytidylyltransferase